MKKKLGVFLLICLFSVCASGSNGNKNNLFFENISVNDGLSHSDVNAVVQDKEGFIWFGTYNGVCKYDGNRMKIYRNNNSALSNNRILSLYVAHDSLLYIGTEAGGLNIYHSDTEKIESYLHDPDDDTSLIGNVVNAIFEDWTHRIWICTDTGLSCRTMNGFTSYRTPSHELILRGCELGEGTFLLGTNTGIFTFDVHSGRFTPLFANEINQTTHALLVLPDGNVLIGSAAGLFLLEKSCKHLKKMADYEVLSLHRDSFGRFWVGTNSNGLYLLDHNFNLTEHFCADILDKKALSGNEIRAFCEDFSGVLWIGLIGEGVDKVNINDKKIELYTVSKEAEGELGQNRIITFIEDNNHLLWVGTRGSGIEILNRKTGLFTNLIKAGLMSRDLQDVSAFYQDKNGAMWVGTWKGLYVIPAKNVETILAASTIGVKKIDLGSPVSIYKIVEDRDGYLWLSTSNGVYNYIPGEQEYYKGTIVRYGHDALNDNSLTDDFVTDIFVEPESKLKTLWIGTRDGLNKLTVEDIGVRIRRIYPDGKSLFVSVIYQDRKKDLWIATLGGGLSKMKSGRFEQAMPTFITYKKPQYPFVDNEFETLLEDRQGNFWIGGYGIVKFNPESGKLRYYTVKDRLQSSSFKIWASCRLSSGEMVFGGVKGFNIFCPDSISDNQIPPKVVLTGIQLFNQEIHVGDTIRGQVILPYSINHRRMVTLDYDQNNITFEFAALHYASPSHNTFRYKLEGFDEEWNFTDASKAYGVYTNLPHGTYKLIVYGANSDAIWNSVPAELDLVIEPPFWHTKLAYVLYIGAFILFLYLFRRSAVRKSERRHQREMENQLHIEQEKSLNNKLKFFTDISHEIKTPLSLIVAPVEELISNPMLGNTTRTKLKLINQNVKRLMTLVEQIMDIRKYDNNVMKLKVGEIDLSLFIEEIVMLFKPAIRRKNIVIKCDLREHMMAYVDKEKFEKVIVNLLSNALKFTSENGYIRISCEETEFNFIICVEDSGDGIVKADLEKVFDRFYQSSNIGTRGGTGIGLSLARYIVEQHKGKIWVDSEPGKGAKFYIQLLKGKAHFEEGEILERQQDSSDGIQYEVLPEDILKEEEASEVGAQMYKDATILIAEDNEALCTYLKQVLDKEYTVITAPDGQTAYETALTELPDLIITDIVMPGMTGIELCDKIKTNINTSHIPVLILTARDMLSYEIEGYATGADAYVTKPFSLKLLRTRIKNLILSRRCMKEMFRTQLILEPSEITVSTSDERLLSKCLEVVEMNMHNPEFGVNELGKEVGISRPQLYRKIKSLTGLSAVQFIRSIRLKRAAQILAKDNSSVSEVMYSVGINNLSYFSKIFKEEFGYLPKQFKKE